MGFSAKGALPAELEEAIKAAGIETNIVEALSTPVIALGIVVLFISLLGCATARFKNPCFAIPFALVNLLLAVLFLVVAFIALGGETVQDPLFNVACMPTDDNPALKFDALYSTNIDKVMCSRACPCKADVSWELGTNDGRLRAYGRTIAPTAAELAEYLAKENEAAIVPMFYSAEIGIPVYSTFKDCFDYLSEQQKENPNQDPRQKEFAEWAETNAFDVIAYLESELSCAGVCTPPLFFVTQVYTEQPELNCLKGLVNHIEPAMKVAGYACVITAVVALLAFCGSFPLCSAYNKE